MKMCKRFLTLVLAVVLTFGMTVGTALADDNAGGANDGGSASGISMKESYTYTVTFYAGNQGTFQKAEGLVTVRTAEDNVANIQVDWSDDKIVVKGLLLGDEVGINPQQAVKLDAASKYYVKGIRLSGRDNSTVAASVFVVSGDADYVVAYGIKGNQVSYTVKYQDANGKQLAPDEVYYGNVGDKPVVAYKYISGYAPKSLGLTKTLSENAAENIFTFVYVPVPTPTINEIVDEVIVEVIVGGGARPAPGGSGSGSGSGSGTGTGTGTGTGESESESETVDESQGMGEDPSQDGQDPSQGESESESESESGSGIIVDLDDPEVPLGPGLDVDSNMLVYGAIGIAALAALIAAIYLIFMAKATSKKTEE